MTDSAAPSILPSIHIDLNVRCSDHGSTTYSGLEDVYDGGSMFRKVKGHTAITPGAVVLCYEPESGMRGLGVVKHIDHERGLVFVNVDFRSLHD